LISTKYESDAHANLRCSPPGELLSPSFIEAGVNESFGVGSLVRIEQCFEFFVIRKLPDKCQHHNNEHENTYSKE
jgi:hypothetical protein